MAKHGAQSVELVGVIKHFGSVAAVDGVDLMVQAGEFVTLLGPSGSGKSTTLMLVAGFERPSAGEVRIGGARVDHVPPYRRNLGVVFQSYALFPHMTVAENLAFPLEGRGAGRNEIETRVTGALARVRLEGHESRYPSQISGGQQQRVALARALVFDPPVLLMDEPLSALDKKLREQMQLEIKHIQRDLGITVIYVTHDQGEALTMSDRIAVMNRGKIAQLGTPEELYEHPADRFVADFIGETNLIALVLGRVDGGEADAATSCGLRLRIPAPASGSAGAPITVSIRPERVTVARVAGSEPGKQWHDGRIEEVIYLGEMRKYRLRVGEIALIAKEQTRSEGGGFAAGERVAVGMSVADLGLVRGSA